MPSPTHETRADPLAGLNPEQRQAVTTTEGPVLVLAGAGSGKTKVITARIAYLLARGVKPESVMAVTFTNKAAREMRERVASLIGAQRAKQLVLGTFHAYCVRLLREHGTHVGVPSAFTICDGSDQMSTIRSALREVSVGEAKLQPAALQAKISLAKNRLGSAEDMLAGASDDESELVARAWKRYQGRMEASRALDFDDLLLKALELLERVPQVAQLVAAKHRYCMVDEYQDTNRPQYEILRRIAGGHRNLCVVGDDDQSIYGWRGADVRKILDFQSDFPGAVTVRLETNYRSTEQILGAANRVIRNNSQRHEKTLRSAMGAGPPVVALRNEDEFAEADAIAREIRSLVDKQHNRYRDIAVLFRTGTQPRPLEEQFRARTVPYVLVGGMSYFDRKEVRDVLAYWRLFANPSDEASFLRIVNVPPRGIGKVALERASELAGRKKVSIMEAFRSAGSEDGLGAAAQTAAKGLLNLLDALRSRPRPLVEWLRSVITEVGYRAELERLYPDAATRDQRWATVEDLFDFAARNVQNNSKATLHSLLDSLSLSEEEHETDEGELGADRVTLMTLHSAKGLEFQRVYLAGLEEGILPHARSVAEDSVEEERRLMYVGITRARWDLTLSWCASRSRGGQRFESHPSRFLFEIEGKPPPRGWQAAQGPALRPTAPPPRKGGSRGGKPERSRSKARKSAQATGKPKSPQRPVTRRS